MYTLNIIPQFIKGSEDLDKSVRHLSDQTFKKGHISVQWMILGHRDSWTQ